MNKEYPEKMCPKCGYTWNPRVPLPKRCARCGLCMPEWREYDKDRLRQYYKTHRGHLRKKGTKYREEHHQQIRNQQNANYQKERKMWCSGVDVTYDVWLKAEALAGKILAFEDFNGIFYLRERGFPFDYFAKKDGEIHAIDVTTAMRKPIRPFPSKLTLYLNLKYRLLFIKPDFTMYRLVPISPRYLEKAIYKSINIHNLKGFKQIPEEILNG